MITICKDLWLHDGAQAVQLTDTGVASEYVGVFVDGKFSRTSVADLEDAPPLGESSSAFVILFASLGEAVQALRRGLIVRTQQFHDSLVDLDAGDDPKVLEDLDERRTVVAFLEERLVEQNNAAEVLPQLGLVGGKQQLAVESSVLFHVLEADGAEAFPDRPRALVSGEKTLPRRHYGSGCCSQLFLLCFCEVRHRYSR